MIRSKSSMDLIVLVVLCSMTKDRHEIAIEVLRSIKEFEKYPNYQLIIIDNGSSFKVPHQEVPQNARYLEMERNLGYWGILYWFLFSKHSPLCDYESEFVYIVESDHIHFDTSLIGNVLRALKNHTNFASARVQEFSVNLRWFYSKNHRFLPFKVKRSITSLRNVVTGDKVRFHRMGGYQGLYAAKWHARLPSVSRLVALKSVFHKLSIMETFTEFDFFVLMSEISEEILVLNHGVFFPASSSSNSNRVLSGSWMNNYEGRFVEYQPTRQSHLSPELLEEKAARDFYTK